MSLNAREAALKALCTFEKGGAYFGPYLDSLIKSEHMDVRDAALAEKIALGVLQNSMYIDAVLEQYSKAPVSKMDISVKAALRIGAYQLLYLTKIPESAAVNESVAIAKKYSNIGAARLVNAVLRKVSANRACGLSVSDDTLEGLSLLYSHPLWIVREIADSVGIERCRGILKCNNSDAPMDLQVNTLKCAKAELLKALADDGITADEHPWIPDCLTAVGAGRITDIDAFKNGWFYIQDGASKAASLCYDVFSKMKILDCCAAPGGKTVAAAIRCKDAEIISCDIHEKKLDKILDNCSRLGISNVSVKAQDASKHESAFENQFDLVICDVPCSGIGVIRKKPEIRFKKENEISGLPEVQKRILNNISKYVKPGGTIVYSTCTVLKRENEDIVNDFLSENPNFMLEEFSLPTIGKVSGMLTFWPGEYSTDGFFIARIKSIS